jgi:hypothetical protein
MFGTSEQAVKIYGLWFKLKNHYFCSMFHCRTSKFAGESAIEFPSFLGTNSRSIPDQVLWSKLFVLIFPNFHWVGSTEIVQETIKNHQNKIIYIYINKFYPWFAEEIMPTCSMGQPSMLQA